VSVTDLLALESPSQRRSTHVSRTLHHDKASPFQMLHKALGADLRHDFIGVVLALAALEEQRIGQRLGEVVRMIRGVSSSACIGQG
jgi:hypothetical protein